MRRAARADANQPEIVEALRKVGAKVAHLHVAPGLLDLLVGFRGRLYWVEVKDGRKKPSDRELTPAEKTVFKEWREFVEVGAIAKVESVDDAMRVIGLDTRNSDGPRFSGCSDGER